MTDIRRWIERVAMRAGYRLAEEDPGGTRWIYVPRKPPARPFACTGTSLRDWR